MTTCPFSKTTVGGLGSPLWPMASEPYHFDLVYRNSCVSGLASSKKVIGYSLNNHATTALVGVPLPARSLLQQ